MRRRRAAVLGQERDMARKAFRIVGGRQKAGLARHHQRAAAGGVGADARKARGHRFQGDIAEAFAVAGKDENVGRGIGRGQFFAVQEAGEDGVRQCALGKAAVRPIAHDHHAMRDGDAGSAPRSACPAAFPAPGARHAGPRVSSAPMPWRARHAGLRLAGRETRGIDAARPGLEIVPQAVGQQRLAHRLRRDIDLAAGAVEAAQDAVSARFSSPARYQ